MPGQSVVEMAGAVVVALISMEGMKFVASRALQKMNGKGKMPSCGMTETQAAQLRDIHHHYLPQHLELLKEIREELRTMNGRP